MGIETGVDPGLIIGDDFKILAKIGEGGMGVVYDAVQMTTGHRRAVKVMHSPFALDPKARERFEQEARVGSQVLSDHVVQVLAAGIDERTHTPWLAMELLQGVDLERHIRHHGAMPIADITAVMSQVVHALAAAHDVGVVHRDVKPENVFLSVSRTVGMPFLVKVLDFGIAKLRSNARAATVAVGTPGYMAPEQTSPNDDIGPPADVWPLGLMVFRMLTGSFFWRAAVDDAALPLLWREMLVDPIPRASERAREVGYLEPLPDAFDDWFAACVERDPTRRFQHARAAGRALESVLGTDGLSRLASDPRSLMPTLESPPDRMATANDHPTVRTGGGPSLVVHRVGIREDGERIITAANDGDTLLAVSLAAGIPHFHACGGHARCSTCRVVVLEGRDALSPRSPAEQAIATRRKWPATTRLACQAKVHGPCLVRRLVVDAKDASLVDIRRTSPVGETHAQQATVLVLRLEGIDSVLADGFPDDAIHVLERCLEPVEELLADNAGTLIGFEGTAAIATFEPSDEGVRRALRVALRSVARVRRLNPMLLKHFGVQVDTSAGLGRGIVVVGTTTSNSKQDRVMLGAAIREARRACDLAGRAQVLSAPGLLTSLDLITSEGPSGLQIVRDFAKSDVVFLVQTSFDRLEGQAMAFADAFYAKLFELRPSAAPLFEHTDMRRQNKMLMDTLSLAVRGLDDFSKLESAVRELGQRHVDYGVELRDYKFVGQALIETLEQLLGDAFTPEAELAWREVYSTLVRTMTSP